MPKYVLAIDQGTTGSTALLLDKSLRVAGKANCEFPQHFPQPGWVEHDLKQIWASVLEALKKAMRKARAKPSDIAAIGITNQRETVCLWERGTVKPAHRAIVWQDRRTAADCQKLKDKLLEPLYRSRTGLLLDPYFSGTKLAWLLREVPGLRDRAQAGDLCFGTIDSFLVAKLSGGAAHVTDVSNASRTLLFDIHKLHWDPELLAPLEVPQAMLPKVVGNAEEVARTKGVPGLPDGIPIAGMAGDQQAALFGQACFEAGEIEVHLRHRRVPAPEHRREGGGVGATAPHHGGLEARRGDELCARGQLVHRRGRGAVAARRARAHQEGR